MPRKDFYGGWALSDTDQMATIHEIEESLNLNLDFDKLKKVASTGEAVLPVVLQDAENLEVLLVAYVNRQALQLSLTEKRVVLYSTSRREIWRKGDTSGDTLELCEVRVNCEQNSLLFLVKKQGQGSCHTKRADGTNRGSCYYRKVTTGAALAFIVGSQ